MRINLLKSLTIFIWLFAISACSSGGEALGPDGAKEIKTGDSLTIDLPETELFNNGKRQYSNGLFSVARESFLAIRNNYPTGPYAEYAELKIADTLFENFEYASAGKAYEDFIANRPASPSIPYATLRAGRSFELSSSGIGRDPTPLQKALKNYDNLIQQYPDTIYLNSAHYYKKGVEDLLASYEKSVIDFYESKNKSTVSEARNTEFKQRYGVDSAEYETTAYDKKAPVELTNAEPNLESQEMARSKLASIPAPIVSGNNFSNTTMNKNLVLAPGQFEPISVNCNLNEKLIQIYLQPPLQKAPTLAPANISSGVISIQVPGLTLSADQTKSFSCFSSGDLNISQQGSVKIYSQSKNAKVLYIDNPSRLLVHLTD